MISLSFALILCLAQNLSACSNWKVENDQDDTHAKQIAEFAVDAVKTASKIMIDDADPQKGFVRIRVGFHSGSVVSNVIGSLNPR